MGQVEGPLTYVIYRLLMSRYAELKFNMMYEMLRSPVARKEGKGDTNS